jgi:hypothetical protein
VHPGGIRTRIAQSARMAARAPAADVEQGQKSFDRLLSYPPEKAAEEILAGVERRRGRVLITTAARVLDVLARLLPSGHVPLLVAAANRGRSAVERGRAPVDPR